MMATESTESTERGDYRKPRFVTQSAQRYREHRDAKDLEHDGHGIHGTHGRTIAFSHPGSCAVPPVIPEARASTHLESSRKPAQRAIRDPEEDATCGGACQCDFWIPGLVRSAHSPGMTKKKARPGNGQIAWPE